MGYYVEMTDAKARIDGSKLDEAYQRLIELDKHDEWKRGGLYGPSGQTARWYSWLDQDYATKYTTAVEILEALDFSYIEYTDGGISLTGYDNKHGQEDLFLWAISDLFDEGSFIIWRGEDGEIWAHQFGGGKKMTVHNVEPCISDNGDEFVPATWSVWSV